MNNLNYTNGCNTEHCKNCKSKFYCSKSPFCTIEHIQLDQTPILEAMVWLGEESNTHNTQCCEELKELISNKWLLIDNKISNVQLSISPILVKMTEIENKLKECYDCMNTKIDYLTSLFPEDKNKLPYIKGNSSESYENTIIFSLDKDIITNSINRNFIIEFYGYFDSESVKNVSLKDNNGTYKVFVGENRFNTSDILEGNKYSCEIVNEEIFISIETSSSSNPSPINAVAVYNNIEEEKPEYIMDDNGKVKQLTKNIFGKEVYKTVKN